MVENCPKFGRKVMLFRQLGARHPFFSDPNTSHASYGGALCLVADRTTYKVTTQGRRVVKVLSHENKFARSSKEVTVRLADTPMSFQTCPTK